MNITYKSSENSNLDTFHFFRIYNIFKYLDCDSTYIMLVIYYCSILYKSLVWVLIIREWMRSAIWKNACDRNQKKSQINVEFLHSAWSYLFCCWFFDHLLIAGGIWSRSCYLEPDEFCLWHSHCPTTLLSGGGYGGRKGICCQSIKQE